MTRFVAELVSGEALEKLRAYEALMRRINRRFNLVSPASAEVFWERHIEHCLVLASRPFPAGASVVDWGTGGGLPAVPLAILFPAVQFTGVDSVGKKVHAVRMAARELDLSNLSAWNGRAEAWPGQAMFAVSRATAPLADLWTWSTSVGVGRAVPAPKSPGNWPAGLVCLKGGDLTAEIADLHAAFPEARVDVQPISPMLPQAYFQEKCLVTVG